MEKMAFVIWVLGFPMIYQVDRYLKFRMGEKMPEITVGYVLFCAAIWIGVGYLVY